MAEQPTRIGFGEILTFEGYDAEVVRGLPEATEVSMRTGFGEPLTFEGADADAIRNLLETGGVYLNGIKDYWLYQKLLRIAIPPVDTCEPARDVIHESYAALYRVETVPDLDNPDREAFEVGMSRVFESARVAFKNRPAGCEMRDEGDDHYACSRCHFNQSLDVDA